MFRPPPRSSAMVLARVALVFGLAPACGGNRPVARGYESRELLPIRNSTFSFNGSNGPGIALFETTDADGGVTCWAVDLVSGATENGGTTCPPSSDMTLTPPPVPPYTCSMIGGSPGAGPYTLGIDADPNAVVPMTEVPKVVGFAQCPGADGSLIAFVQDASGNDVLMTGPFTNLQPVSLPINVTQLGWWTSDSSNAVSGVMVLGTSPSAPEEMGFYAIDFSSFAVTTEVPAVPVSTAWAPGATPSGSLQSTSLAGSSSVSVVAVGSYFLYPRLMSDGGTTMFAGPFTTGTAAASELALFQIPSGTSVPVPMAVAPSPVTLAGYSPANVPQLMSWQIPGPGMTGQLVVWDAGISHVTVCPSPATAYLSGIASPDGTKTLYVTPQPDVSQYSTTSGPLILFALGSGPGGSDVCTTIAGENVVTAGFSPDNAFLYWVVQPPTGEAQLWVANSDGTGSSMVGTGVLQNVHFIVPGGAQLEMILGGDLVWMDLHDSSVNLHYVAQQVFDLIYDIHDQWLLAGYDYSSQDTNGTLGLINRSTGEKRMISPEVAQFTVVLEGLSANGGFVAPGSDASVNAELSVVYLVHGRNPSAQDGIWTATITAADLQ